MTKVTKKLICNICGKEFETVAGSVYDLEEHEVICPDCDGKLYGDSDD